MATVDTRSLLTKKPVRLEELADTTHKNPFTEIEELALEAKEKLGYATLHELITQRREQSEKSEKKRQVMARFLSALQKAERVPFDSGSVERYKQAMEKANRTPSVVALLRFITLCKLVFIALPLVWLVAIGATAELWYLTNNQVPLVCTIASVLLYLFSLTFFALTFIGRNLKAATWRRVTLSECMHLVPEEALRTALVISEMCPEVEWSVDELHVLTFQTIWRESFDNLKGTLRDPFLVAEIEGNVFYLEVWNEPHIATTTEKA